MAINFSDAVKHFGTPIYLYDFDGIAERIKVLRAGLDPRVKLIYAVKANPNLKLLKELRSVVDGLDISSGGEIKQATLAGYNAQTFSFAGPGKTESELRFALQRRCGSLSVESVDDLARIGAVAEREKLTSYVSIRINPLQLINKFAVKMGGKATQFGIDEENLDQIFAELTKYPRVSLIGFHIYAGTQCLDAASFKENFDSIFTLLDKVITKYDLNIQKINLGGGFGIPYFGEDALNIQETMQYLNSALKNFAERYPGITEYILELGRYLVGEYGYYLTRVVNVKKSRDKIYIITDGGMHQNLSASGNLGQVIKKNYKIQNVSNPKGEVQKVDIVGNLCTPIDILASSIEIPEPRVGDVLMILNSGAYGFSASPLLFLGHDTPAEVMVQDNKMHIIRPSRDITEFN